MLPCVHSGLLLYNINVTKSSSRNSTQLTQLNVTHTICRSVLPPDVIFDVQCGVNLACGNILDGNSQKYFPGTAHWRIKVGYTALKDLG